MPVGAVDVASGFERLVSLPAARIVGLLVERLVDRLVDRLVARLATFVVAAAAAAAVSVAAIVVCPQRLPGVRFADAGMPWSVRRTS